MYTSRSAHLTLLAALAAAFTANSPAQTAKPATPEQLQSGFGKLPLAFEPNHGQTDPAVQFLAHTPTATVYLTGSDAVFRVSSFRPDTGHGKVVRMEADHALRMHLAGAAPAPAATTAQGLPGKINYLTTQDRAQWHTDLPTFGRVHLAGVYPGVDLTYYGQGGRLEYDFLVAPNADPGQVRLQFQGAGAHLEANGDLTLPLGEQTVRLSQPVAYQQTPAGRQPVQAAYAVQPSGDITFRLGAYNHSAPLVIDPQLVYFGTLGTGQQFNNTGQVVVDSTGATYYIGTTQSPYFPVTPGAYQTVCGPAEGGFYNSGGQYCNERGGGGSTAAYVTKISPDGSTLVYSTYLSGHLGTEGGGSIAVDSTGVAYILGNTASNDFPITSDAFQKQCLPGQPPGFESSYVAPSSQCNNYADGGGTEYTINGPVWFYAKLSADGSTLLYSSFLGGSYPDYPVYTALDSSGNWYLYGQSGIFAPSDIYGTGGGSVQFPGVTSNGYIHATSNTVSAPNEPNTYGSCSNALAVASKFSNDGKTLLYGTFLGDLKYCTTTAPQSFAVGANGVFYMGGAIYGTAFPTTASVIKTGCTEAGSNPAYCNTIDGFITAVNSTSGGLVYSTRLGGTNQTQGSNIPDEQVSDLAVNASGDVYATGVTYESTFPTTSTGYQSVCPNQSSGYCNSTFVVELNKGATQVLAGTFLNGSAGAGSVGESIALDSANHVFVYGQSNDGGGDFPQVNGIQPNYQSGNNLYFAEFNSSLSSLLFSTRFGNPGDSSSDISVLGSGGMALDSADNIYFAASTTLGTVNTTPGTYTSAQGYTSTHTVFGKISNPLLANSTATVSATTSSVQTGASASFKVTVTGGKTTPTGSARVFVAGIQVGTVTLAGGTGSLTAPLTNVPSGADTVGVIYSGDTTYGQSTGYSSIAVTGIPTTTAVSVSPGSVYVGQSVTATATVKRTGSTTVPTGSVTFYADGAVLTTVPVNTSGVASFTASTAGYPATTYSVTAQYNGDSFDATSTSTAASLTLKNTVATTTTLTLSPNPDTRPASVTGTATVKSSGGTPTGTVNFYVNGELLGTADVSPSGVATLSSQTSGAPAGTFPVYAIYQGSAEYNKSTSNTVQETLK